MIQRGRKSSAALSVVPLAPGARRPDPPDELTPEQADEWRAVVGRMPADWFTRENQAMLVDLCRHVVIARRVSEQIDAFDPAWLADDEGLKRYDKLTAILERHTRTIASLSTRMRLTQQSRYNAAAANTASEKAKGPVKPWEFGKSG
jgi:phage terminase small subunit